MPENIRNNGSPTLPFDESMCERYLLGELSESDQERFETAYFCNDVFFDRFMAVKNELLDLYSRGELDPQKQEQVRKRFSETAPRRKYLAESRQFIDAVTTMRPKTSYEPAPAAVVSRPGFSRFLTMPSFGWAAAAFVLFMAAAIWWLSRQPRETDIADLQPPPAPEATRDVAVTGATPATDPPVNTAPPRTPEVHTQDNKPRVAEVPPPYKGPHTRAAANVARFQAYLVLGVIAARDISESNTLRLYSDTSSVSIELTPPGGPYKRYTAAIKTLDGELHWQTKKARPTVGKKLTLELDARVLRRSDYILTLRGVLLKGGTETVAEYYFHIVRNAQKTPSAVVPK